MYTKPSRTKASSLFKNKHILLSAFTMSSYIKLDPVKSYSYLFTDCDYYYF